MKKGPVPHRPGRHAARLPLAHRVAIRAAFGLAWVSGAVGFWAKRFGRTEGEFGPERSWVEGPAFTVHGLAAMACLVMVGTLLPRHVPAGWLQGERRASSLTLLTLIAALALSGWGLSQTGHEGFREALAVLHSAAGLLLPVPLLLHARRAPPA